jgi:hypothetical protein
MPETKQEPQTTGPVKALVVAEDAAPKKRDYGGRPTELTDEVRSKIEAAAAFDATLEEIAFYAGVHRVTLYRWLKDDEELRNRVDELRQKPILKARQTVVEALQDPNHAFRYLERKRPKEFMPSAKIEHSGTVAFTPGQVTPEQEALRVEYEEKLRKTLVEDAEKPAAITGPDNAPEQETAPAANQHAKA